jgi:hypothetical protein
MMKLKLSMDKASGYLFEVPNMLQKRDPSQRWWRFFASTTGETSWRFQLLLFSGTYGIDSTRDPRPFVTG